MSSPTIGVQSVFRGKEKTGASIGVLKSGAIGAATYSSVAGRRILREFMPTGNNRIIFPMKGGRYELIRRTATRSAGRAHGDCGDCGGLLFYGGNEEIRGNGQVSQRGSDH